MPSLITKEQFAFILGTNIHDSILSLQELAHPMFKSKGKYPLILFKIDLEKAFDKISWNAIYKGLAILNFPETFIKWIRTCIESPNFLCHQWYPISLLYQQVCDQTR